MKNSFVPTCAEYKRMRWGKKQLSDLVCSYPVIEHSLKLLLDIEFSKLIEIVGELKFRSVKSEPIVHRGH